MRLGRGSPELAQIMNDGMIPYCMNIYSPWAKQIRMFFLRLAELIGFVD